MLDQYVYHIQIVIVL